MSNLVSWALVSLNEVKEALDITTSDHDAKLNGYINRATGIIEVYCQRRFISTTHTNEVYSGNGSAYIYLRNYPITALTASEYMNNSNLGSPSYSALQSDLFAIETMGGVDRGALYYGGGFIDGVNNYRFSYTAGYTDSELPHDLREACIELVGHLFNSRKADRLMKSESLGQYSYTRESVAKTGLIKALGLDTILDLYRSIPI